MGILDRESHRWLAVYTTTQYYINIPPGTSFQCDNPGMRRQCGPLLAQNLNHIHTQIV